MINSLAIKQKINFFLDKLFGYQFIKTKLRGNYIDSKEFNKNDLNLNIGSGGISYPFFINLDMPSKHYEPSHEGHKFIAYNLIKDELPFKNDSVSNIYCSHVVEHCTDEHVQKLFYECIRVLKKKGILRLTCPDSKFLYEVCSFENEFWRKREHVIKKLRQEKNSVDRYDYIIERIASNKSRLNTPEYTEIHSKIKSMKYEETMDFLTRDNKQDINKPGNHINFFDYEKLEKMLKNSCLDLNITNYKIVNSKCKGSVSQLMAEDCFDKREAISVFVDFVKL